MKNFNSTVSKQLREKRQNKTEIKVGQVVKAVTGKGMFANCLPPQEFTVAKINKKTFKTACGKTIDLINLR